MQQLKFNSNFGEDSKEMDENRFFETDLNCFEDSAYNENPNYAYHLTTSSALKGIEAIGFKSSTLLEANYFSKKPHGAFYLLKSKAEKIDWSAGDNLVLIVVDLENLLKNNDPDLLIDPDAYRLISDEKTPPIMGYAKVPDFVLSKYGII